MHTVCRGSEWLVYYVSSFLIVAARNHVDLREQSRLRRISTSLVFGSQAWSSKDLAEPFLWAHRFVKTLPTSVEDIFIEVGFSPYDAILLPQKQKEWQELDHILASHPGNFTVRLGICLDYHFCDPDEDDPCYSEWPTCSDMEEYFRNFLLVDGMPEMNKLGHLNCEITRSALVIHYTVLQLRLTSLSRRAKFFCLHERNVVTKNVINVVDARENEKMSYT